MIAKNSFHIIPTPKTNGSLSLKSLKTSMLWMSV